jgi:predicted DNA binding CopG/RHH family protein
MRLMDERTLAEIEAEMNDPDAWGEPEDAPAPKRRSERRQRAAVVSVRLNESELEAVQEYAAGRGLSLSGVLRTATLEVAATVAAAKAVAAAAAVAAPPVVVYLSCHGVRPTANGNDAHVRVGMNADSDFALAR